jgi:hypothetical protein
MRKERISADASSLSCSTRGTTTSSRRALPHDTIPGKVTQSHLSALITELSFVEHTLIFKIPKSNIEKKYEVLYTNYYVLYIIKSSDLLQCIFSIVKYGGKRFNCR